MKSGKGKKRKKRTGDRYDTRSPAPLYCTQCGATLDGFAVSGMVPDLEQVRKNFERCRKTGKFSGEFCSKLFIASPVDLDTLLEDLRFPDEP